MGEQTFTPAQPTEPTGRRSCCFWGCITLAVAGLIAIVIAYFGIRYMYDVLVEQFTDESPMTMPQVEMSDQEVNELRSRIQRFVKQVENDHATEPLVLTDTEINGLIQNAPAFAERGGAVHVAIEDDQISGQVSLPLGNLGLKRLKGRYFNGTATFDLGLVGGNLVLSIKELSIKGDTLPANFVQQIQQQDILAAYEEDPTAARVISFLEKLDDIDVQDGKLRLVPKSASSISRAHNPVRCRVST